MDNILDKKNEFEIAFRSLSESRKNEISEFYDKVSWDSTIMQIIRNAKDGAEDVIAYADRKCYGYGEVGYNINENVKDFAEDVPELEKEYKRLINAYFNFLIESKNI